MQHNGLGDLSFGYREEMIFPLINYAGSLSLGLSQFIEVHIHHFLLVADYTLKSRLDYPPKKCSHN